MIYRDLEFRARNRPGALAMTGGERGWTYAEILGLVNATARILHQAGVKAGDKVSVPRQELAALLCHFALDRLGACCTQTFGGEAWVPWFVTTEPADDPRAIHVPLPARLAAKASPGDGGSDLPLHEWTAHEPYQLRRSSGTTGRPKWIQRSYSSAIRGLDLNGGLTALVPGVVCAHRIGAANPGEALKINAWRGGATIARLPQEPERIFDAIQELGVSIFATSPVNLQNIVRATARPRRNPGLRIYLYGGRLSPILAKHVGEALTDDLVNCYGATEVSGCTAYFMQGHELPEQSCGYVRPGVRVQVVAPDGSVCEPGTPGRIRIHVLDPGHDGYLDDEGRLQPFGADPQWFDTADSGVFEADGLLRVFGREDEVANVGGFKFRLEDLQDAIEAAGHTMEHQVLNVRLPTGESRLAVVAVMRPGAVAGQVLESVRGRMRLPPGVVVVAVKSLPRLPNAKVDVQALRETVLGVLRQRAGDAA